MKKKLAHIEERPYEDTVRRCWLRARKRALSRKPICWPLDLGLLSLSDCERETPAVEATQAKAFIWQP